ncbi:MAG: tRNA dihydrouridine synthase DusB [Desulfobacter sp.]|nr:tRNA dihydrouridine synthase DusB [Desulfobacter sp.]WDP87310.1 MAG: tRNA dihydrouridine synthase DusB [Desulfobacter sp.]
MKIKNLNINGTTFLAPLAGITNLPFRQLVKECGAAVVCSEMISAKGIFYNSEKTLVLLESTAEEKPLSVQIFGSDPESMGKAAAFIDQKTSADIIDINFGCSVKKVIKQGAGVALMKEPGLACDILQAVRQATTLPFTIKIRSGWDNSGNQALALAKIAQNQGVDAIAIHPRTAAQGFKGKADWTHIKRLKQEIDLPVIGNGDINSPEDAAKMMALTQCDGVMVGRAAMANPFILSQIEAFLDTGRYDLPLPGQVFRKMERLIRLYVDYFGESAGCKMLRGRLAWFVKGLPGATAFRRALSGLENQHQALELIQSYERTLEQRQ